ncbi:hypothetical protein Taro_050879, partial [Colocasia esculenta]|nr:hypothetical protein [Colocasia esculenta]
MLSAIWPCMPRAPTTLVTPCMEVPTVHGRHLFPLRGTKGAPRVGSVGFTGARTATAAEMGGKRGSSAMAVWAVSALLAAALLSARAAEGMAALEICNMDAEKLADCLPAVRGPVPPSPSDSCCAALRAADLPCFCRYKDSLILRSVGIDPKLAAALPTKCSIELPPECSS